MTEFIFRYRWIIIVLCFSIGAGSILLIPLNEVDPEIRNYIPKSIESRIATDMIEDEFGVQDLAVVLLTDSCIINKNNLNQIKDIDRSISRISGVSSRLSPFTVKSISGEDGNMIVDPLIKRIPSDSTEAERLGKQILENRFARGIVVSSDLTTASITATINNSEPEKNTIHKIDSVVSATPGNAKITKGGLPYIRGSILNYHGIKMLVTYHPAALLRNPNWKKPTWEDVQLFRSEYDKEKN